MTAQSKVAEIFETMEYGPAPESAATVREWLEQHKSTFGHFINGQWQVPAKGKWFEAQNPATGEKLGRVSLGTKNDVDAAVKAARKAQKSWAALDGFELAKYLYAVARLIQKNSRLLAVLETLNNGKPIRETRDLDVSLAARHFYHHAGWAQIMDQEFPGYEAYGVVGQVIPWNFPFLMLAWKIAPALAAGNTVVLKPAEFTPLSAVLFAELCEEAGLPPGVINIVQGDGSTGAEIVKHPDINKIAFTGSTEVGRIIRTATAGSGKALTLELGGKSPTIVFENADLDSAVEGVVDGIWLNQGEVCCAGSRLLLQEGIAEKMVAKLKRRMEHLRVGSPLDKAIDMGAIVSQEQWNKIDGLVKKGVSEGAILVQPGKDACPAKGCFYPPTMLTNVQPASTVAQEEIFGPVVSVLTFRTPEEAVLLANNTRYGLAASIWSENINLALDIAPKLKAGVVWINSTNMFDAACGFGGYRESGFGREGGREGMYSYLKPTFIKSLPVYKDDRKKLSAAKHTPAAVEGLLNVIDRTAKLYIGGKQARPDGNYSLSITDKKGRLIGQVGEGNRKDIRNAVEAAKKAEGWSKSAHHLRGQILYYIAENLSARHDEFKKRLVQITGAPPAAAAKEVDESIRRLFTYAAWADKYDGDVHYPPARLVSVAMKESVGILGLVCPDEAPLLGFVSLFAPAMAMGNRAVMIPSEKYPLSATDFYQIFDTSDVPAGVVNIVTGDRASLTKTLAEHDEVDGIWYFGSDVSGSALVEKSSVGNLKRTWVNDGLMRNWFDRAQAEGEEFLRHAVEVKNVWIPYGE
ncbi:MAG: aldehyde dehydrogenase family protein [Proteobacteria bacterium]|nr:aldehyde dehydrogenase family protein [Pseudomonadota bacterium]